MIAIVGEKYIQESFEMILVHNRKDTNLISHYACVKRLNLYIKQTKICKI